MDGAPPRTQDSDCPDWQALQFTTPASAPRPAKIPRALVFAWVVAVHLGLGWQLSRLKPAEPARSSSLLIEFVQRPKPKPEPRQAQANSSPRTARAGTASPEAPTRAPRASDTPTAAAPSPLRLYNADGSLSLPDDLLAEVDRQTGVGRRFDYEIKGLASAGSFLKRPPALVYESTRFEEYWQPDQSVLTELLEKAVTMTSPRIRLPVPGRPGSHIECVVVILAAVGSCAVVNNNDGYVVELDDPDTLDAAENQQCQAWWEQIVGASSQQIWRKTQSLYEAQCRKPLAKAPPPAL